MKLTMLGTGNALVTDCYKVISQAGKEKTIISLIFSLIISFCTDVIAAIMNGGYTVM